MKHLAKKFCRRNNVYTEFDGSVGKLIEKSYLSAYLLCLHENKNKIAELEVHIAKLENRNKILKERLTQAKDLLNEFMRIGKASDEDFEQGMNWQQRADLMKRARRIVDARRKEK